MYHVIYSKRNDEYAIVKVDNDHITGYLQARLQQTSMSWTQDLSLLNTLLPHQRSWRFLEWLSRERLTSILSFDTTTPLDYVQNIYTLHPELLI